MKRFPVIASAIAVLAAGTMAAFLAGCEADPATEELSIDPSSAVLSKGESRQFTVSGGYEYEWSLGNPEWGGLSSTHGSTVVYTSRYEPTSDATQTITVKSTIPGTSAGAASNASYSVKGTATAIHRGSSGSSSSLVISPSAATVATTNGTASFAASGGVSPYKWTLEGSGTLSATEGATTVFTAKGSGSSTVTVADSAGHTKSANVTVSSSSPPSP